MTEPCVYVGRIKNAPTYVRRVGNNPYQCAHPKDFARLKPWRDFWTNNPYVVDLFPAERVMVCGEGGAAKPLSAHPEWERWKGEMKPGEFWAWVGEDWVNVQEKASGQANA